jgi:hypothetical protein
MFMFEAPVQSNAGGGLFMLLGVLFIALKLTGVIDWSWWWVTMPLWFGVAVVLLLAGSMLGYEVWQRVKAKLK